MVKILLIMIHYENNNFEAVRNSLDNMRDIFRNKKVSEEYKKSPKAFCYFIKKLSSIKFGNATDKEFKIDELMTEINDDSKSVPGKKWFHEKLLELKESVNPA